ncbi:MAG: hypothetical protein ACRD9R_15030 [Pyrinomonadaceae bacterium]
MKIAATILTISFCCALAVGQERGGSNGLRAGTSKRVPKRRNASAPRVGNIENLVRVSQTVSCGFYFSFPDEERASVGKYVFISQVDGEDAWMNLNNRDTPLKLIRISPYPKERIGARRRSDYFAGGFAVRVETIVTRLSDENNYEPTRFKVGITVSKGTRKKVVSAVGYAGC